MKVSTRQSGSHGATPAEAPGGTFYEDRRPRTKQRMPGTAGSSEDGERLLELLAGITSGSDAEVIIETGRFRPRSCRFCGWRPWGCPSPCCCPAIQRPPGRRGMHTLIRAARSATLSRSRTGLVLRPTGSGRPRRQPDL